MNKLLFTTILIGGFISFTSCEKESEDWKKDVTEQELLPGEDYGSMLYLGMNGIRDIKVLCTDTEIPVQNIKVLYSSQEENKEASASLRLMNEEELAAYCKDGITYKTLPQEFYALEGNEGMSFNSENEEGTVTVSFKNIDGLKSAVNLLPDGYIYSIPLVLNSENETVNSILGYCILGVSVVNPEVTVTMQKETVEITKATSAEVNCNISLNMPLNQEYTPEFVTDETTLQQLVEEYNTKNGTSYELFKGSVSSADVSITQGEKQTSCKFTFSNKAGISYGNYLYPVKIKESEAVETGNSGVSYVIVDMNLFTKQITLNENMFEAISKLSWETNPFKYLIDNTYGSGKNNCWHSNWSEPKENEYDATYGVWLDVNLSQGYKALRLSFWSRGNNQNAVPATIRFYGKADDSSDWISLTEELKEEIKLPAINPDFEYKSPVLKLPEGQSIKHIRISFLETFDKNTNTTKDLRVFEQKGSVALGELKLYDAEENQ